MNYPQKILMVKPNNYCINYKINPFMTGTVNKDLAMKQWENLKDIYIKLGFELIIHNDQSDLPDMVFCANPFFSHPRGILLSNMRFGQRKEEVNYVKKWFSKLNQLQIEENFEGMGDLLYCYQTSRLFGGYGFRTKKSAYTQIDKVLESKIQRLELVNENFYHLDTCLCIIDKDNALIVEKAFTIDGLTIIKNSFKNIILVDEQEAITSLACNAHSPNGKDIIVEKSAIKLQKKLEKLNFNIHLADTSEFIKAGGSIFCMKHPLFVY